MLIKVPAQTTFQTFLETLKKLCSQELRRSQELRSQELRSQELELLATTGKYVMLFLTFKGCYSSLLSKDRWMSSPFAEQFPLVEVDIHSSPEIYTQLLETMPAVIITHKLPVHLFCKLSTTPENRKLQITPLLRNFTTLGDAHFHQIKRLVEG